MSQSSEQLRTAITTQFSGRLADAEAIYREVLAKEPDHPDAVHLLGMSAQQAGRHEEALELLHRAVTLDPKAPHFQNNLGNTLARGGNEQEAVACFREAIRLRPDYVDAHANLGLAMERLGKMAEALEAFDHVTALRQQHVAAHQHRGIILRKLRRLEEAAAAFKKALALDGKLPEIHHELAAVYGDMGNQAAVIECHTRLAEILPRVPSAGSDLVHVLHYDPAFTPERLSKAAVLWAEIHAEPLTARGIRPHENDRTPGRRIRIGYVSPDFHDHPIARLMVPILQHLNRAEFEAVCYSDSKSDDRMNTHLRSVADVWHDTATVADGALSQMIREHRIDILVDLAGHMGGNRLPMFATKPAPIQVTHFNYPDTTGMSAMDYRMSDLLAEPPGITDGYSTEKLVRLPNCAWCYDPGFDVPDVGPLPAAMRGHITFCSLNKPIKHSAPTIALWLRILKTLPNSRLMLLGTDANVANSALRQPFAAHGIHGNRLLFAPRMPRSKYLGLYNDADIALDPFPYNGGVTSCDAMWMGVPIIALKGNTYHSRQGHMLLTNLGLPDLVAKTAEEYMANAVRLASDLPRLTALRSELRQRMKDGHIADGAGFTRDLESAYRRMWRAWCEGQSRHG